MGLLSAFSFDKEEVLAMADAARKEYLERRWGVDWQTACAVLDGQMEKIIGTEQVKKSEHGKMNKCGSDTGGGAAAGAGTAGALSEDVKEKESITTATSCAEPEVDEKGNRTRLAKDDVEDESGAGARGARIKALVSKNNKLFDVFKENVKKASEKIRAEKDGSANGQRSDVDPNDLPALAASTRSSDEITSPGPMVEEVLNDEARRTKTALTMAVEQKAVLEKSRSTTIQTPKTSAPAQRQQEAAGRGGIEEVEAASAATKPKPDSTAVIEEDQETSKNKSSLSDSDFGSSGGKVIRGFQGGEFLQQVRRLQERAASEYNYAAGSQQQCESNKELTTSSFVKRAEVALRSSTAKEALLAELSEKENQEQDGVVESSSSSSGGEEEEEKACSSESRQGLGSCDKLLSEDRGRPIMGHETDHSCFWLGTSKATWTVCPGRGVSYYRRTV